LDYIKDIRPAIYFNNKKSLHIIFKGYSIIGSRSRFTVNLGSDSLGKSNDLRRV